MENESKENLNRELTPTADSAGDWLKLLKQQNPEGVGIDKPYTVQPDLGWTTDEIKTLRSSFKGLKDLEGITPELITDTDETFNIQAAYAAEREKEARLRNEEIIGRRRFIKNLGLAVLGTAVVSIGGVGIISWVQNTLFSEEAMSNRALTAKENAEKARQNKLIFEQERLLGLDPSAISKEGWDIRYIRVGEKAKLTLIDVVRVIPGSTIEVSKTDVVGRVSRNTGIVLLDYQRVSDSIWMPVLVIPPAQFKQENWLLTDQPRDMIDNRLVVFRNVREKIQLYLNFKRLKTNPVSYEVEVFE